jgi:hypothetical protein
MLLMWMQLTVVVFVSVRVSVSVLCSQLWGFLL